jgi:hypothetical protein
MHHDWTLLRKKGGRNQHVLRTAGRKKFLVTGRNARVMAVMFLDSSVGPVRVVSPSRDKIPFLSRMGSIERHNTVRHLHFGTCCDNKKGTVIPVLN